MPSNRTLHWQMLVLFLVIAVVLWFLAPVLTPFVVAALFAYMGDPLVDRLEKIGLSRTLAAAIVFLVILLLVAGVIGVLVPLIQHQVMRLIDFVPRVVEWVQSDVAPLLQQHLGIDYGTFDSDRLVSLLRQHIASAGGIAAVVLQQLSRSSLAVLAWLTNLVLIPVVTFYLLRDWDDLVERMQSLLPRSLEPTISRLCRESNSVLGQFVRGQVLVMVALGLVYGIGLWLVGISVGPLIGMVAGLVSFVPYLGFIVGLVASLIAAMVQYHDVLHIVLVLVVFGIGQMLEGYVLTPRLVGDKIGLHPVAVIFAVLAGGQLFGFTGILLALPVASVIMVLLRYAHERYMASELYRRPSGSAAEAADANAADTQAEVSDD